MAESGIVEIQMPQMGESVTEGTVLEWHKQEGEFVEEGETVVEVSTDKVDAEVPAPESGVIKKILAQPDDTIEVGQALAQLDPDSSENGARPQSEAKVAPGSDADAGRSAGSDAGDIAGTGETPPGLVPGGTGEGDADLGEDEVPAESPTPGEPEDPSGRDDAGDEAGTTLEIVMPEMGESVAEGTVLEWLKEEGEAIAEGDTVVEVSTDKVDAEVPAPAAGTLTRIVAQPDETVKVGAVLAEMRSWTAAPEGASESEGRSPQSADTEQRATSHEPRAPSGGEDEARISPVAKRIAAANGIDLSSLVGSGPGGKITKADVLAAGNGAGTTVAAGQAAPEAKPLRGPAGMLAQAMDESRQMPTATSFRTLAVDTLDAKRKALNGALKERGMKVSFTHLVAWAIIRAAGEFPVMARTYAESGGKPAAIDHERVNLGIAVDVQRKGGRTLMVPCIAAADQHDFASFHSAYEALITKTRENKLTADDFQGTNVTLTNPGGIGTIASVPRLMSGQGTIVATGSIAYPVEWAHAPADRIKALGISKVMTMTSTYDHRVIQGAESGSFLRAVDALLQGEDAFYESVAEDLGVAAEVIAGAYPAAASSASAAAPAAAPAAVGAVDEELLQAVQAATSLLKAYRTHGHLAARLDPLGSDPKGDPALEPENLNLSPELMSRIPDSILRIGVEGETLLEVLPRMREAYCGTIGYQIEHLSSHQQRMWLRDIIETRARWNNGGRCSRA